MDSGYSSAAPGSGAPPEAGGAAPTKRNALVMFGSPGSGKGTQSKFLVDWLKIPQISTGDMLRNHIRNGTAVGRAIASRMRAGSLVSDELVNQLVYERIHQSDCDRGFILDGYPRTPAQAQEMMRLLAAVGAREVVIHLVVDYNVIISRMTGRRVCLKCGTLYNSISRPPQLAGVCDRDGESLSVREDDREEVVRERLNQYEASTRALIDYFRQSSNRLFEVDASQARPEDVFSRIQSALSLLAAEEQVSVS